MKPLMLIYSALLLLVICPIVMGMTISALNPNPSVISPLATLPSFMIEGIPAIIFWIVVGLVVITAVLNHVRGAGHPFAPATWLALVLTWILKLLQPTIVTPAPQPTKT